MAQLTVRGGDGRPFPPGDYPVLVVGSGPGGLQTSYSLSRLGIQHAVLSQDEKPGGMFQYWPIFQRLLSWTKPDAPYARGSREYEWYDHNSLIGADPSHQALVAEEMDRSFTVPSRPEMERGLAAFADKCGLPVRYGCRWESTREEADGFTLVTSDGDYRCRIAVFAVGITEPWRSPIPGLDQVPHYVDCRDPSFYRGKTIFIVGKRNSGFEIADGLAPWARQIILGSPRPVQSAVLAAATVRVRYFQPYEDASWGGGTFVLNASIEGVERTNGGWRLHASSTEPGVGALRTVDVDEVIAATGFRAPLQDLPDLGVETVAQGRIPALTPFWESATVQGVFFAGNATQGAPGLRRHGIGGASATVSGFRYNAQILARLIGNRLGVRIESPPLSREELVPYLCSELTRAPELWAQKAYLARVVTTDDEAGLFDEGILPLAHFVDAKGPDAVAATVEMDGEGRIYPVLYRRLGGAVEEQVMSPNPLHAFEADEYTMEITDFVKPLAAI